MSDRSARRLQEGVRKQKFNHGAQAPDIRFERQRRELIRWWYATDRLGVLEWLRSPRKTVPKPVQRAYRAHVGGFSQGAA